MAEAFARGDFMANRGTPIIDDANDLATTNTGGHIIAVPFAAVNLAASQTNLDLALCGAGMPTMFKVPKAGSIVGITVSANADVTAGTATFAATIGGTETALTAALSDEVQQNYAVADKDTYTVSAGNLIGMSVTTGATWDPETSEVVGFVLIEI